MDFENAIKQIAKENYELKEKINSLMINHTIENERLSREKTQTINEWEHKRRLLKDYEREINFLEEERHNFDKENENKINHSYLTQLNDLKNENQKLNELRETLKNELFTIEKGIQQVKDENDIVQQQIQASQGQVIQEIINDHDCRESESYRNRVAKINEEIKSKEQLEEKIDGAQKCLEEIQMEKDNARLKYEKLNSELCSIRNEVEANKKLALDRNNHLFTNIHIDDIANLSKVDQNYIILKRKIIQCDKENEAEKKSLQEENDKISKPDESMINLESTNSRFSKLKNEVLTTIARVNYLEQKLSLKNIDVAQIEKHLTKLSSDEQQLKILLSTFLETQKTEASLINLLYQLRTQHINDAVNIEELSQKLCLLRIQNIKSRNEMTTINQIKNIDQQPTTFISEVSSAAKSKENYPANTSTITDFKELAPAKVHECRQQ